MGLLVGRFRRRMTVEDDSVVRRVPRETGTIEVMCDARSSLPTRLFAAQLTWALEYIAMLKA